MREDPFISLLIEKLNRVKRDREVRERLEDSLQQFCEYRSRLARESSLKSNTASNRSIKPKKVQRVHWEENVQQGIRKSMSSLPDVKETKRKQDIKDENQTVVGYCFGLNSVPFTTKVRGKGITLAHFKTLFNRKGKYRYFFKKYSKEFGTDVVFEEVINDEDILPLWDGKIFAIVEEFDEYRL